jgi:phosphoesterase RecJ-like protein
MRIVDVESASAAQLAARFAAHALGKASIAELPTDVAEAAYLGLASDTGWFRNSNTSPAALRDAADLIEAGADHNAVRRAVEQGDEPTRLMLMHRVLGTLRFHERDRIATMCVRDADMQELGASMDDAGGLVDLPSSVRTTRVSVLLSERGDGIIKASMRSKAGCDDEVDVNAVARLFGGGGHVHAAGAKMEGDLEQVRTRIVTAIAEQFA